MLDIFTVVDFGMLVLQCRAQVVEFDVNADETRRPACVLVSCDGGYGEVCRWLWYLARPYYFDTLWWHLWWTYPCTMCACFHDDGCHVCWLHSSFFDAPVIPFLHFLLIVTFWCLQCKILIYVSWPIIWEEVNSWAWSCNTPFEIPPPVRVIV